MSSKIKQNKLQNPCTNCFSPQYLKINFSYMEDIKNVEKNYKLQFLDRLLFLSSSNYMNIIQYGKEIGFELEPINELKLTKVIPKKFSDRFSPDKYNNKIAIARLYTNNNPIVGRIIGVIIKNIFYIFFLDIGGKLYKH